MTDGRIFLSAPDVRQVERDLLIAAVDSGWVAPAGPDLEAFEQELAAVVGVDHAVALSSGTAALHLALILAGVGPGDEVIVSSFTFAAAANVVTYVGAKPVFVDCDKATWNLSPDLLEDELVERSRQGRLPAAVIAVDLYGQCCDFDRIVPLCRRYGVTLIEDAAEALGASVAGRKAGTFGDFGAFSFNGNKIITTSAGGMLVTSDGAAAERARYLSTQAKQPAPHYEHTEIGFNYRLSNLLAAFGRGQLMSLNERVRRRRWFFGRYSNLMASRPGIEFMPEPDGYCSTRWLTCCTIDARSAGFTAEDLRRHLESQNIESRPTWKPMHLQPVFAQVKGRVDGTSQQIFETGICLPSGSGMTDSDLDRVLSSIAALLNGTQ